MLTLGVLTIMSRSFIFNFFVFYHFIISFIFIVSFVLRAFCHLFNKRILDWTVYNCYTVLHWRPSIDRTAAVVDPIARYSSRITIFAYPTCIRRPHQGEGSRRNIAITFIMVKLKWRGYPTVKKFADKFIRFDIVDERDGWTDRQTPYDGISRAYA